MLDQIQRSDSGKATASMPQGHLGVADPESEPLTEGAEAKGPLPQGLHEDASPALGSSLIDGGKAILTVPQGHVMSVAPAVDVLCAQLAVLQTDRLFAIRQQIRCDNATAAYIRTRLGYTSDPTRTSEADRKRLAAAAKRIKKSVEGGDEGALSDAEMGVARQCSAVIIRAMVARQSWDEMREETEKQMRRTARELPVYGAFVEGVRGLSDLGLAVVVGEAGNLAGYPKKGHLWKRLGLAVIDGAIQGRLPAIIPVEERAAAWKERGYKPRRRAEIYAFLDDVMLRAQWQGGEARGPYGAHYARKKAEYLDRFAGQKGGVKHADRAARRYMAKMLIRDLLTAWREVVTASV